MRHWRSFYSSDITNGSLRIRGWQYENQSVGRSGFYIETLNKISWICSFRIRIGAKMSSGEKRKYSSDLDHHNRYEYCRTRLKYRAGRNLTAVKVRRKLFYCWIFHPPYFWSSKLPELLHPQVYSVCCESSYLLVFGVPKINLQRELMAKFKRFGDLETCSVYSDKLLQNQCKEIDLYPQMSFINISLDLSQMNWSNSRTVIWSNLSP